MATILRMPSPGRTSYQARLPVVHDPDVRAKPRPLSPRAANGTPSRDGADKALGPHVAAAHPLRFHPSGASQYVVEYRHLASATAIFAVFAHSCQLDLRNPGLSDDQLQARQRENRCQYEPHRASFQPPSAQLRTHYSAHDRSYAPYWKWSR